MHGVDHKTFLETETFESTKVSLFDSKLHFTNAKSMTSFKFLKQQIQRIDPLYEKRNSTDSTKSSKFDDTHQNMLNY